MSEFSEYLASYWVGLFTGMVLGSYVGFVLGVLFAKAVTGWQTHWSESIETRLTAWVNRRFQQP